MIYILNQSALEKITPTVTDLKPDLEGATVLCNEEYVYQIVVYSTKARPRQYEYEIETDVPFQIYLARQTAVTWPHYQDDRYPYYVSHEPCVLPDCLEPMLHLDQITVGSRPVVLWVTTRAYFMGKHEIKFILRGGEETYTHSFFLDILQNRMPNMQSNLNFCTSVYPAALAEMYHVPAFSDRHWELLEVYFQEAVKAGATMLVTPVMPMESDGLVPDDPTQLVGVHYERNEYLFNFDLLRCWIEIAQKAGFKRFFIPSLFPSLKTRRCIRVRTGEFPEEERPLVDPALRFDDTQDVAFVRSLFRKLNKVLREFGDMKSYYFQTVVDPRLQFRQAYEFCRTCYSGILCHNYFIDIIEDSGFEQDSHPSVTVVPLHRLYPAESERQQRTSWCSLDITSGKDICNFLIASSALRLRLLGLLCFRYGVNMLFLPGFSCYEFGQKGAMEDPLAATDNGGLYPSGSLYMLYPDLYRLDPRPSMRLWQFRLARQDYRLLIWARELIGADRLFKMIDKECPVSLSSLPQDPEVYFKFRAHLLEIVQKYDPKNKN